MPNPAASGNGAKREEGEGCAGSEDRAAAQDEQSIPAKGSTDSKEARRYREGASGRNDLQAASAGLHDDQTSHHEALSQVVCLCSNSPFLHHR